MNDSLVSVIVPVYNGERYLAEALDSILAQDYRPVEVIVVDDGSTDRSGEIARSFNDVRYLRQENQGPAAARNNGMAAANGGFLSFCDADDLLRPTKVSAQVAYLGEHVDVDCVLVRHEVFFEAGVSRPAWLLDDEGAQAQSALVRRSVIERVGGFDPAYRLTEGIEWLSRMRDAGVTIALLPEVLQDRRIHGGNLSYHRRELQHYLLHSMRSRIARARGEHNRC